MRSGAPLGSCQPSVREGFLHFGVPGSWSLGRGGVKALASYEGGRQAATRGIDELPLIITNHPPGPPLAMADAPSPASDGQSSKSDKKKGKEPMAPPPQPPASNLQRDTLTSANMMRGEFREPKDDRDESVHSRASDAGSVKSDSASDAHSTATMDTSMSAGTLASGASTAFFSQQVRCPA